jgi:arylsulfatase A-like enzyme
VQAFRTSLGTFVLRALFLVLVFGVAAGLVSGLLEIRAQRYLEQGLTRLAVLVLSREMNRVVIDLLVLVGLLGAAVAALRGLTRSWAGAAVYGLAVAGTFAAFVLSTNLFLYHAAVEQSSKFLQNFQHNLAPEQLARLMEPVRGTFLGAYSLLLADFSEHWGKLLLLCVFNILVGMGAGWLLTRLLKRVWPGLFAGSAFSGWAKGRLGRVLGWLGSWKTAGIAGLVLLAANGGAVGIDSSRGEGLRGRPNVILISIDTLRADHLSCYGYERNTSPALDELAGSGVLFEEVLASSPWTLPSHVSMVTSLSPATHGCSLVGGAKLQKRIATLAEILRNQGYRTHAITTILYLTGTYGFDQGFDRLVALGHRARAGRVTDEAVDWVRRHRDERFFLFLHYYDPHSDYAPPAAYRQRFDPGYEGPIDGSVPNLLEVEDRMSEADLRHLVALYDGEIAYVDDQLKRLLDEIKGMGLRENTVIVLTADHGEEFREHGGFGHGFTLYDEQLRVPLLISWPGRLQGGRRVKGPVQLIDIVPTLIEMLKVESFGTTRRFEGVSLVENGRESAQAGDPSRDAFSQTQLGDRELYADRVGGAKAIYDATSGRWELYDLSEDPGETNNLAARDREGLSALSSKLDPYIAYARRVRAKSQREGEKVELDEKSIETLKSLGYIQ